MTKVSVIIPNYNHADYLKQRVDSVLNQTYKDFEVIILDDCSADNSKQVIEQYSDDKRISHIIYNEINSGNTFKQWDKGIQLANGEYIWIAESDDWCENNFLETVINGLDKNDNAVFGYCQSFCVNEKNEIIFQSGYSRLEGYYPPAEYLEKFLCFGNSIFNASMAVFRKSFYYAISDAYKSFRFVGDWIFWAELSRLGSVYINAKPLNYFRKHNKDVSGKMYASGLNFIEEINALDFFHEQLNLNYSLYFKARVKLYNRFMNNKARFNYNIKNQVRLLFFNNVTLYQKQYFLILSRLYKIKLGLLKKINAPYNY